MLLFLNCICKRSVFNKIKSTSLQRRKWIHNSCETFSSMMKGTRPASLFRKCFKQKAETCETSDLVWCFRGVRIVLWPLNSIKTSNVGFNCRKCGKFRKIVSQSLSVEACSSWSWESYWKQMFILPELYLLHILDCIHCILGFVSKPL